MATVGEAAAGEVEHGCFGPVGLIEIIYVLACFPVVGHHALVVDAVAVALLAYGGLHVGELPDGLAPEPRAVLDGTPIAFVREQLELFGMTARFVVTRVVVVFDASCIAVFGYAERLSVFGGADTAEKFGCGRLGIGLAEIFVQCHQVGTAGKPGVVDTADGKRSEAARVGLFVECVDGLDKFHWIVVGPETAVVDEYLVEYTPEADGRMIEILIYHFEGDPARVVFESLIVEIAGEVVAAGTAQRYFAPEDDALFVAHSVDGLRLRIVGQSHHGGAGLHEQLHVGLMVGVGQSAALAVHVFMSVEAAEGIARAVEEEAEICVHMKIAQSGALVNTIGHPSGGVAEFYTDIIHIWILASLPQGGAADGHRLVHYVARGVGLAVRHNLACSIGHGGAELHAVVFSGERQVGLDGDICLVGCHLVLPYHYAGRTVEQWGDAIGVGHEQMARAVYAAVDVEVTGKREHVGAEGVAHPYLKVVDAGMDHVRYLDAESGVSTVMAAGGTSVYEHIGHGVDTLEV